MKNIVLASASPRRRDLLTSLGLSFTVYATDVDESAPEELSPGELVAVLSRRKAEAAAAIFADSVVVAADTVVSIGGKILGKPKDEEDAARMLRMLSGSRHTVYTGVTVISDGEMFSDVTSTDVYMRELEDGEIRDYIRTGEPCDKAGAYGIQGLGGVFVTRIEGEYFNVTGMPKEATARLLRLAGVDILSAAAAAHCAGKE